MKRPVLLTLYDENTLITFIMKILLLVETIDVLNITDNYGSHKSKTVLYSC
jgi:hypothetical protein